jgi:hypothetical protein
MPGESGRGARPTPRVFWVIRSGHVTSSGRAGRCPPQPGCRRSAPADPDRGTGQPVPDAGEYGAAGIATSDAPAHALANRPSSTCSAGTGPPSPTAAFTRTSGANALSGIDHPGARRRRQPVRDGGRAEDCAPPTAARGPRRRESCRCRLSQSSSQFGQRRSGVRLPCVQHSRHANHPPCTRDAADRRSTGVPGRDRHGLARTAWVRGALSVMRDPGTEFRQYRRPRLCGRFQEGPAYRLLVRGELRWPGRCNAVRARPPPGEATTCPARCDHKASRADAATTRLALRLTILPPGLPPNGSGCRMAAVHKRGAKEAVREAMAEIFPPGWNCPASVRQQHIGSDQGFCL